MVEVKTELLNLVSVVSKLPLPSKSHWDILESGIPAVLTEAVKVEVTGFLDWLGLAVKVQP